jgi:hypothetical protein
VVEAEVMVMDKTHLIWVIAVVAAAFAHWVFFALRAIRVPEGPKKAFLISSGVMFVAWMGAFLPPVMAESNANNATVQASVAGSASHGSCAAVQPKDSALSVAKKLGKPDEKLNDEAIRGPGAVTWVYRDTRCAVHIIDNEVDFVE